jgi:hypothetical protein
LSEELDLKLNKTFSEICEGFSVFDINGTQGYIKHFNFKDQRKLDYFYSQIFESAKSRGLPTKKETLKFLHEEGLWVEKDERAITTQELYVNNLEKTKANLILESQKDQVRKDLVKATEELNKLLEQKQGLLSNTCESYAQNKLNHEVLFLSLYKDEQLTELFYAREEFEDFAPITINKLLVQYNEATNHLGVECIKKLATLGIFTNYYNIVEKNPQDFFRESLYEWTFYQLNLINYGKIFKNIFDNVPDIPDVIKEDPDALLEFAQSSGKRKEAMERSANADSYSLVGATQKDLEHMGVEEGKAQSLESFAKKKGGKLGVTDFADMFGK